MDKLAVHTYEFFPEGTIVNEIAFVNNSIVRIKRVMTDCKVSSEILDEENSVTEENKESDASNEPTSVLSGDVRQALDIWRDYMSFSSDGECIQKCQN